ncbi:hypothetical protein [Bacillus licheniformis]|uniref:hypothetical protein n=1 Tax=Bacillus licheniformis TaxID=1402 RepID=UPI001CD61F51|nr:hypothetical protein [Bacillus licheniformis]MCA1184808.1 hypothetical protein [Bacillus licheniformis]
MSITKMETREVFDRSKIGKGDVIEFSETEFQILRLPPGYYYLPNKTIGIVKKVSDQSIEVYSRSLKKYDPKSGCVTKMTVGIGRADSIKILYRHPANEN